MQPKLLTYGTNSKKKTMVPMTWQERHRIFRDSRLVYTKRCDISILMIWTSWDREGFSTLDSLLRRKPSLLAHQPHLCGMSMSIGRVLSFVKVIEGLEHFQYLLFQMCNRNYEVGFTKLRFFLEFHILHTRSSRGFNGGHGMDDF
jgi:hypothetical protein